MQDPGSQYPYGGPQPPYNPYGGYNPYAGVPPTAKQQAFGCAVTQDERSMAMAAHLLQLFTGFLGPLIIYFIKKDQSKFVAYHALQAIVWHILYAACTIMGAVLAIVLAITNPHSDSPPFFFMLFMLLVMGGALLNWVLGIVYTVKAYNGDWGGYPVIGQWVKRFL